ncbi:hypothetical protein V3C99_008519 [Haemonchus contortus]
MQGHRQIVQASLFRLADQGEAPRMDTDTFIVAPFRERQIDYMVFTCQWKGIDKKLASFMADVPYYPSQAPAPFDIRLTSKEHQEVVRKKLHNFDLFLERPNDVGSFLAALYSTACGTITAYIAESTDTTVHAAIWSSPNINSFPVLAQFRISMRKKAGWAVGRSIQGACEQDLMHAQIVDIEMEEGYLDVTIRLDTNDGVRCRAYLLASKNQRIAVGTFLHAVDERANPVLALMEHSSAMAKLTPNTIGWKAARLLLAGDVQVSGYDYPDQDAITVTVAGSQIKLNSDQVNAVNMYNKEFPIQIVDSAYGAGKSVCASKMAEESAKLDHIILVTAVQNSALDVIGAKIDEMQSQHIRAVRYISETVAQNIKHQSPFALQTLMENFHVTHGHLMPQPLYKAFKQFSDDRRRLRNFMFSCFQAQLLTSSTRNTRNFCS